MDASIHSSTFSLHYEDEYVLLTMHIYVRDMCIIRERGRVLFHLGLKFHL